MFIQYFLCLNCYIVTAFYEQYIQFFVIASKTKIILIPYMKLTNKKIPNIFQYLVCYNKNKYLLNKLI